jgi:hypothetical protein
MVKLSIAASLVAADSERGYACKLFTKYSYPNYTT